MTKDSKAGARPSKKKHNCGGRLSDVLLTLLLAGSNNHDDILEGLVRLRPSWTILKKARALLIKSHKATPGVLRLLQDTAEALGYGKGAPRRLPAPGEKREYFPNRKRNRLTIPVLHFGPQWGHVEVEFSAELVQIKPLT